jgi:hypothetical protein
MAHFNKMRQRTEPNDEWITPSGVVEIQLSMIKYKKEDLWLDPFKNDGAYYKRFPCDDDKKDFTEIIEGKDFFKYDKKTDIICSNPPYSLFKKIYVKVIELRPRIVSFVMSQSNLTRPRLVMMREAGYNLTKIHHFDVKRPSKEQRDNGYKPWMPSFIVQWELNNKNKDAKMTWSDKPFPFIEKNERYKKVHSQEFTWWGF